jgi:hypothetical protein
MTAIDSASRLTMLPPASPQQQQRLDMLRQMSDRAAQGPAIPPTPEEMYAAYRKEHPLLTPQQALASNAELGPPTGGPKHDNRADNIHTEIKVNGKVIARTYNTGLIEIADEYGFLSEELGFNADTMVGPDAAADRAARVEAALAKYGAVIKDEQSPDELASAMLAKLPILELVKADTALTQAEWMAEEARKGTRDAGAFFSRTV